MRSNRGVTTTSLIIYVIAMAMVIGIIASITSFFYSNVVHLEDTSSNISGITKFNMYFLQEVKSTNNEITRIGTNYITFITGNTFKFQDNSVYMNNSKILENVKNLEFSVEEVNDKIVINTIITIGENMEYTKATKYVMGNVNSAN